MTLAIARLLPAYRDKRQDDLIRFLMGVNPNLIALYPLNESAGAAIDYSPLRNTGTQDPDNVLAGGSFFGRPCLRVDGNGGVNIGATSLFNALNIEEWSVMIAFRMLTTAPWTDGTERDMVMIADGSFVQRIHLYKTTGVRFVGFFADIGANQEVVTYQFPTETLDWHVMGMTASVTADEMRAYMDGAQVGTTQTGLGTSSGALTAARIGVRTSGAAPWTGLLAFMALWSAADDSCILSPTDMQTIASRLLAGV